MVSNVEETGEEEESTVENSDDERMFPVEFDG